MSVCNEAITPAGGGAGAHVPFSPAYRVGDVVYTSGQVGLSPAKENVPAAFVDEVRQTIENLKRVLEAAGCGISSVVKTTCLLIDISDLGVFTPSTRKSSPSPDLLAARFKWDLRRTSVSKSRPSR